MSCRRLRVVDVALLVASDVVQELDLSVDLWRNLAIAILKQLSELLHFIGRSAHHGLAFLVRIIDAAGNLVDAKGLQSRLLAS